MDWNQSSRPLKYLPMSSPDSIFCGVVSSTKLPLETGIFDPPLVSECSSSAVVFFVSSSDGSFPCVERVESLVVVGFLSSGQCSIPFRSESSVSISIGVPPRLVRLPELGISSQIRQAIDDVDEGVLSSGWCRGESHRHKQCSDSEGHRKAPCNRVAIPAEVAPGRCDHAWVQGDPAYSLR